MPFIGKKTGGLPEGVTYRRLDYWIRSGHIRAIAQGSGNYRVLDESELDVAEWIAKLMEAGFILEFAGRLARAAVENPEMTRLEIVPGLSLNLEERVLCV